MAKYKPYDLNQAKLIPISYADQIMEGSFEYALNDIIEHHLDLSVFDARYANDTTGRLAYDPRVLLKIVVYGYYKGIISSRTLAEACRRNVVFMALSADTHFTTIAAFVSELHREIASLFRDVLLMASELGLIGKEHFAVDGCKLPSNASKQWSGTHKELDEKRKKLERVAERIVLKHQQLDDSERQMPQKDAEKVERYRRKVEQLKAFLKDNDKKRGPTGNEQKANLTDPDSAKMTSSHGVIQGYNGLAVVDDKTQVVVHAEAHGTGYEAHLLAPVLEATRNDFERLAQGADIFEEVKITADSGFHSKVVVAAIEQLKVNAYVADRDYRRRQPEFADAVRYKERRRKERALQSRREREAQPPKESKLFTLKDFIYDESRALCICPAAYSGQLEHPFRKHVSSRSGRLERHRSAATSVLVSG
jgi:transposase